jgi:hypothetical protein
MQAENGRKGDEMSFAMLVLWMMMQRQTGVGEAREYTDKELSAMGFKFPPPQMQHEFDARCPRCRFDRKDKGKK